MKSTLEILVPVLAALITSVIGTVVTYWLQAPSRRSNDASKLRDELWEELGKLREEIKELKDELDEWKTKYYVILAENVELKQRYQAMAHSYRAFMRWAHRMRRQLTERGLVDLVAEFPVIADPFIEEEPDDQRSEDGTPDFTPDRRIPRE